MGKRSKRSDGSRRIEHHHRPILAIGRTGRGCAPPRRWRIAALAAAVGLAVFSGFAIATSLVFFAAAWLVFLVFPLGSAVLADVGVVWRALTIALIITFAAWFIPHILG